MIVTGLTLIALIAPTGGSETPKACAARCKEKRAYAKAREATPRNPLPGYVVHCESRGRLRAYNPSSGAGGRYQIIPSTWQAYLPSRRFVRTAGGNKGSRWSSRLLQDKVAWTIRKREGLSPWACA